RLVPARCPSGLGDRCRRASGAVIGRGGAALAASVGQDVRLAGTSGAAACVAPQPGAAHLRPARLRRDGRDGVSAADAPRAASPGALDRPGPHGRIGNSPTVAMITVWTR